MAFIPIQKLIPRAANRLGIGRQIEAAHICMLYSKCAPEILHKEALHYTRPRSFRNKTLFIDVEGSAWAHEIKLHEAELTAKINEALGKKAVQRISTAIASFV